MKVIYFRKLKYYTREIMQYFNEINITTHRHVYYLSKKEVEIAFAC